MRAWFIDRPGSDGQLALCSTDRPEAGPGQVLVQLAAIGINRADLLQVKGLYPPPAGFDERRPGLEYAGRIVAVGEGVTGRYAGDRVMGLIGGGAYAEAVAVDAAETIPIPAAFDFVEAAAIPEAFLTGFRALCVEGGARAGDRVLVRGATSGVGMAVLQLADAFDIRAIAASRRRRGRRRRRRRRIKRSVSKMMSGR